jgi:hypothetical protein
MKLKKENDIIKQTLRIHNNNKYDTAILNKISRTNDEQEQKEGDKNKMG